MISIKLKQLAKKQGKNISQIAKETGLNRNTVTALYHNKVDGINFVTLQKICDTYKVRVDEILSHDVDSVTDDKPELKELYKQEGEIIPFPILSVLKVANSLDSRYFKHKLGDINLYFKKEYGMFYWSKSQMDEMAEWVYREYSDKGKYDKLYKSFSKEAQELRDIYGAVSEDDIVRYSSKDLKTFSDDLQKVYVRFWALSLFIDAFDAGIDRKVISEIAESNNLSVDDVAILTTPEEMTFNNEKEYSLLKIVKEIREKKISSKKIDRFLADYVQESAQIAKYMKDFDYYKSTYATIDHIRYEDVIAEIKKYLQDRKLFDREYDKLSNYSKYQKAKIKKVLKEKKLRSNPLEFFGKLTFWREYRKQVNLMGIHLEHAILKSVAAKTGIPYKYAKYLTFDEVDSALKGLVNRNILAERYEEGILIVPKNGSYSLVSGNQATSLKEELEKQLLGENEDRTITGQVASQGYVKGVARIILDQNDFDRFEDGEILITGMTRPEFVPIMKKAAGIVTNEGGITCHAAIVSRELGKPCIIGTQVATQLINDGDLVEVRANHGTVRILERAK